MKEASIGVELDGLLERGFQLLHQDGCAGGGVDGRDEGSHGDQVMGQEASQRVVDAAMQEQPDLKLVLNTKLSCQLLSFHCQVDMSVFQAGKGESEMARKEGRKAFCDVEL